MVKFAEAEKRGRGGDGGDRRLASMMMLERPKISRGMWEALRTHIMKERRKKKEELEADAEEKRMRKERENKKKQHAMTLEETREQIAKEEKKLGDLKTQKHDLVQQLKKVLNEEKKRKDQEQQQQQQQQLQQQQQQLQQQQNYLKESEIAPVHPYTHGSLSISGHPQMIFPAGMVPGRTGISTLYKVGVPTTQSLQSIMPSSNLKRSRSPSPPLSQASYQSIPYVFKSLSGSQNSVVPVTLTTNSKSSSGTSVYLSNQPYYHSSSQGPHVSTSQYTATTQSAAVAPYLPTSSSLQMSNPTQSIQPSQGLRDDKHLPLYLPGGRVPTGHVSTLHQAVDHKGKGSLNVSGGPVGPFPTAANDVQDKFYVAGVRPHLVLHTIPGQQPPPGQSAKGSITTSFPVRAPTITGNSQSSLTVPSTVAHTYTGHSMNMNRGYFQ